MRSPAVLFVLLAASSAWTVAQEPRPVPKDSVRLSIPGCAKGSVFTTVRPTADQPGNVDVAAGLHMHMTGPKQILADIKKHPGQMIELTGLVKRGDLKPAGVTLGGGVRIAPGAPSGVGGTAGVPIAQQIRMDVEGWRAIPGECPSR